MGCAMKLTGVMPFCVTESCDCEYGYLRRSFSQHSATTLFCINSVDYTSNTAANGTWFTVYPLLYCGNRWPIGTAYSCIWTPNMVRHNICWHNYAVEIRYDTRCYFNVRSKADISQLNLPHGERTGRRLLWSTTLLLPTILSDSQVLISLLIHGLWWTISGQVKAHVVLTCTNGVSSNHLPVTVASDRPWTTLSTSAH